MSIAALILGIVGVVFDFIFFPVGLIASIVAIILGAIGRKKVEGKGMATAGLVLGIIGLILGIVFLICTIALGAAIAAGVSGLLSYLSAGGGF
ncbi:MAG: DUF4190 domain-containing protein [Lachnospiraceae bacterium]|nr:DUF4190 domain-containing protein [Lachnospiraceae bacterium]